MGIVREDVDRMRGNIERLGVVHHQLYVIGKFPQSLVLGVANLALLSMEGGRRRGKGEEVRARRHTLSSYVLCLPPSPSFPLFIPTLIICRFIGVWITSKYWGIPKAAQFSLVMSTSSGFCFRHVPLPRLARNFFVISSAICRR